MTSLAEIEPAIKADAEARQLLADRVAALKDGLDALHKEHLPGIKRALNRVAEIDARAKALIEQAPGCFVKPKTLVMHGLKFGYQKGKGSVTFDKPGAVVKRIKKLFPDQVELLIHTEEKPNKEGLEKLAAADLKKLGVEVTAAGDRVVLKPVDGAVDKLVTALLKGATDDAQADAQDDTETEQ